MNFACNENHAVSLLLWAVEVNQPNFRNYVSYDGNRNDLSCHDDPIRNPRAGRLICMQNGMRSCS